MLHNVLFTHYWISRWCSYIIDRCSELDDQGDSLFACTPKYKKTNNASVYMWKDDVYCDRNPDCLYGEDEDPCPGTCMAGSTPEEDVLVNTIQ